MDFSSSAAGAISGGFGIIGSLVNYSLNKRLQEQQNQFNIDMWKLNNEYNSPSAQMQRYQEAGLNPALMYGQVTPGNSSSAPVKGVAEAPHLSRDMAELGKAFNIEGLKQAIADTKLKQANADAARTAADMANDEYEGYKSLGQTYDFDPDTGQFVEHINTPEGVTVYKYPYQRYIRMKALADNYRQNSLLVPRAGLIGSQAALNRGRLGILPSQQFLMNLRGQMIAPQIQMLRYQQKYFPASFWIGNVKNAVQTATPFVTPFLP